MNSRMTIIVTTAAGKRLEKLKGTTLNVDGKEVKILDVQKVKGEDDEEGKSC